jgi:hypothetical protein
MTSLFLVAMFLVQGSRVLQPGSGIVTGTIQMEGGASAAGVRVGAMAPDDPSSLISVAETDSAGRYRLTNVPAGKYLIVAGRLESLSYYPGGTDREKATEVTVDAAKVTTIGSFTVPAGSKRQPNPTISRGPQTDQEYLAFVLIKSERNIENKKRMMLNFERDYPKANRLAEVYMELSRTLAQQTDFVRANQYAEKAVAAVNRMKSESSGTLTDPSWQSWLASLDSSAKTNLAWTRQMIEWQQKQVHNAVLGKRWQALGKR